MENWTTYTIGEIGRVVTGKTPSSTTPGHFGDAMPFVTPTDFKNYVKSISGADRFISQTGVNANTTRIIPEDSVLVTCIGSDMGKVAVNEVPCLTNQQINSIILDGNRVDKDFVYYAMTSKYELLRSLARGGSTMPIINKTQFERIEISFPKLEEQKAIAKILSSLDDKIELNRRMNATLEAMARALFKAWFVDFEPVHANRENRPSTSASPEIAKLFPSEFENGIPKCWLAGTVGENFNLTMGRSPSGDTYNQNGEGEVFYQGRTDFGSRFPTPRVYCTQPGTFGEKGDTLLSVRAPVGDINIAPDKCCIGRGIAAIRHKSGSRSFTYYNLWNLATHFGNFRRGRHSLRLNYKDWTPKYQDCGTYSTDCRKVRRNRWKTR